MSRPSSKSPTPSKPDEPTDGKARKTRLFLGLVCFFAGAAIMVVEISAFRLLAPYFGNTIYTSTSLIGVILVAFSVGGYLGGRFADRHPALDLIGWLLAGAAVLTLFIPALHMAFSLSLSAGGVISGPLMISIVLFALPGVLLGAVSPASVRFYSLTQKDTHVGQAAGTISMLGSLGSFVGTFVSGFFLLSTFGVRGIFVGVGVILLLLAVASLTLARSALKPQIQVLIGGLVAGVIGWSSQSPPLRGVIHERESFYHHISVFEEGETPHKRRMLALDSTQEGGMNPDNGELILDYQRYWKLALLRDPAEVRSALFIGAGAFGMPENVSRDFPQAAVDVVEIDPQVIEVGRKFFKLDEHPRVNAHAADARRFLHHSGERKWDMIFGDAYNGRHAIPSHLATREFFQLVSDHLEAGGVYIMNIIAAVSGPKAELTSGMIATVKTVFPHVEVFDVEALGHYPRERARNIILMCSAEPLKPLIEGRYAAAGSWQELLIRTRLPAGTVPRSEVVFTDNYNPVDAIIARGLLE